MEIYGARHGMDGYTEIVMKSPSDAIIRARYEALVHQPLPLLTRFSLEELAVIGEQALTVRSEFALSYPFSFAALAIESNQKLTRSFEELTLAQQCRTLDVAMALLEGDEPLALLAYSFALEESTLLAVARNEELLYRRARGYVQNPLIIEMIDSVYEKPLLDLIKQAKHLLDHNITETEETMLIAVPTSDELFVTWVFAPLLSCPFTVTFGDEHDRFGRRLPRYLDVVE